MGELEGDQWRKVRLSDKVFAELGLRNVDWGEPDADGFFQPTVHTMVLAEDHELCETQISELTAVLADVMRAKSFDMLPIALRDRVRKAIKTRGITLRR